MKGIGILAGHRQALIDHLVPLCHLMEIPLLVTEPLIQQLIEVFYPQQEVILAQPKDYALDPYVEGYDLLVYVDFYRQGHGSFRFHEYTCKKRARSIMSLHGNPDKYWEHFWLERLLDEDVVLIYGPQLLELLKKKGIDKKSVQCGNYRFEYYKEHAAFFDSKVPFIKQKETVLYAPTWADSNLNTENSSQYSNVLSVYESVFEKLSENYQLIVKLHPLMYQTMGEEIYKMKDAYPHVFFLENYPLIYPLLKQIDIYIGDYSSIGYDFLAFDRPLYFLETEGSTALHRFGQKISRADLSNLKPKNFDRKKLYSHVFGETVDLSHLKQEIKNACGFGSY